jgi:hypothetical protein
MLQADGVSTDGSRQEGQRGEGSGVMKRLRRIVSDWCLRGMDFAGWHYGPTLLLALWAYWRHPVVLLATVGAWTVFAAGSDARALKLSASSLACAVKLAYRRCYLRINWNRICESAGATEKWAVPHGNTTVNELRFPKLKHRHFWSVHHWRYRIRRTPTGIVFYVDGTRIGRNPEGFEGTVCASIASSMKARGVMVDAHPVFPTLTKIGLIYVDPFKQLITADSLGFSQEPGVVPVGRDSHGAVLYKNLRMASLLVGNLGSGKSSEVWTMLKGLIEQAMPFRLRLADPKGGMEFSEMRGRAYDYEDNPTQLHEFLGRALVALAIRQREMSAAGYRKWDPSDPKFPIDRFPLDIMVIDELVTFILMMKNAKITINGTAYDAKDAFIIYMTQIRAAGFTVIACSQLAQKAILELLRDLFTYKTCLRVGSAEIVRMVLDDAKQYPAHKISTEGAEGVGYIDLGTGPVKYRAGYVNDKERTVITELTAVMTQKCRELEKNTIMPKVIELDMPGEGTEEAA